MHGGFGPNPASGSSDHDDHRHVYIMSVIEPMPKGEESPVVQIRLQTSSPYQPTSDWSTIGPTPEITVCKLEFFRVNSKWMHGLCIAQPILILDC